MAVVGSVLGTTATKVAGGIGRLVWGIATDSAHGGAESILVFGDYIRLIVLAASACVLAVAIAYAYIPKRQRMWLMVVLATVIVFAAVAYPGITLMLAQASVLGLVLAVVSLVISRLMANAPGHRAVPVISPSSQRIVMPRSEPLLVTPLVGAASTAPTATLRVSES
jgi:hypothetical protein